MNLQRVRSLVGEDAVVEDRASSPPLVIPRSTETCALVLQAASSEGWKVRVEGAGTWAQDGPPADLALTTTGLHRARSIQAPDLVATVDAGIRWDDLRQALADHGTWLAADPPGIARTLGSIVATGTSGPLRTGFGALRDHLLGITIVTGDGRVLRPGGQVVKNVAGFDLTRLAAGSFGVFGVITSFHLRLRTVPRADVTLAAEGERDELLDIARRFLETGEMPAALELLSPAAAGRGQWTLALRLAGSEIAVEESRRVARASGGFNELAPAEGTSFWRRVAEGPVSSPIVLRLGALTVSLPEALDLLTHHLDDGWVSVSVAPAAIRWAGTAAADRVRLLRSAAAQREFPVTVERAPWATLQAVGHFGAYREGVGRIVGSLQKVFDPKQTLVTGMQHG